MIILASKILPITSPDIENGALVIKKNKIERIGPRKAILKQYPGERVVDLENGIIMPGLVNLHAHLELSSLKGTIDEKDGFFDWIIELVERVKGLDIKKAEEGTVSALKEAIKTGTTCIADISSREISLRYLIKSGIRAKVYLEALGMDETRAEYIMAGLQKRVDSLSGLPDRITTGISPHAPYSVSSRLFKLLSDFCYSNGLSISIHLSETKDENLYMQGKPSAIDHYMKRFGWDSLEKNRGRSPATFLNRHHLLKQAVAVHAVHVNSNDIALLKSTGSSVAHCPRSNHYLNVGSAPVAEMTEAGINVGLGTDSLASNLDMNMWEEMRFAYLVNRLPARKVIEMATINGARALGLEGITGSIEPGKEADIIAVKTPSAMLKDPYPRLLLDTKADDITFTMVQGKAIYSKNGQTCNEF